MELFYGLIKIDNEFLASHPFFTIALLTIIAIFLFLLTLSKPLLRFLTFFKQAYFSVPRVRRKVDWTAECKDRQGWIQKGDAIVLGLEGKNLRELTFLLEPKGRPKNWRGGFIIGNPAFSPNSIVDSQNAITCHIGSPPVLDGSIPVWIYDKNHERNHPYSTLVKSENRNPTGFSVKVNENNFLTIEVDEQLVYAKRIDSSFRKKVYLLAWGDNSNCSVKFSSITYYI
jgi:hypothetical protein